MAIRPSLILALTLLSLSSLGACRGTDKEGEIGGLDADGDGVDVSDDCDDGNSEVYPGNTEVPYNGLDDDCDEATPDDDLDGDGFLEAEDCDDTDAAVNPDAIEACNGVDDDCNGTVDDSVGELWYDDDDGDGFGDAGSESLACDGESGQVADASDCDDRDPSIHPGADEVCNEVDDDCDGDIDEGVQSTFYLDDDGDGFGGPTSVEACAAPEGSVANSSDCDDTDAKVSPVATEVCDEVDNDCDGDIDDASGAGPTPPDATTWYEDGDSDGYAALDVSAVSCVAPSGYLAVGAGDQVDCDDTNPDVNPGATEVCNEVDDDCDGDIDDADSSLDSTTAGTWYLDYDGDGYAGSAISTTACSQPGSYEATADDCDDTDAAVNPGATEICNALDDDCDGDIDDDDSGLDTSTASDWYADSDGDGYGDADIPTTACDQPSATVADDTDCDDTAGDINPGEDEQCDDTDHDCDGDVGLSSCEDCEAILAADSTSTDGYYDIDIDGSGGEDPFEVYCDMTLDGGGWTQWWWYDGSGGMSGVTDVLGETELWDCDPRSDADCFAPLPSSSPDELLVTNQTGNWAVWEFDTSNTTAANALDAFVNQATVPASSTYACNDAWEPVAQDGTMSDTPYVCDENNNYDPGCDCFWYASQDGIYSFYLDDDTAWAETAFGAGYDSSSNLGVDSLETTYRYHDTSYELYLYWR